MVKSKRRILLNNNLTDLADDILFIIFSKLNAKAMFAFKLTCKRFFNIVEKINNDPGLHRLYQPYNHLTVLLQYRYVLKWDTDQLELNPNFSLKYYKNDGRYLKHFWDSFNILHHPSVKIHKALKIKDLPSDYHFYLSLNPNITIEYVLAEPNVWNYNLLSYNPGIKLKDIENNENLPWNFRKISKRTDLTLEFIEKYKDKNWNYKKLSKSLALGLGFVRQNLDKPWDFMQLTANPAVVTCSKTLKDNEDLPWDFDGLVYNPNITCRDIKNNLHLISKKAIMDFSFHPSVTIKVVEDNPKFPWCYKKLSSNENITLEFVLANRNKKWNYELLCKNKSITWKQIKDIKSFPKIAKSISSNPSLTCHDVLSCFKSKIWNFDCLAKNKFSTLLKI